MIIAEGNPPVPVPMRPLRAAAALPAPPGRLLRERDVLVFDLDGTLVDSAADVRHTLARALSDCGLPAVLAERLTDLYSPLESLVRTLLGPAARDPAVVEAVLQAYDHQATRSGFPRSLPYPGVRELLLDAVARGQHLAVCTNKSHGEALRMLDHFGFLRLFDLVVGAESAERPKPDPAPLRLVLNSLGAEPSDAVLVGDTHVDALCAHAADVAFVWHRGGYGSPQVAQLKMAGSFTSYAALRHGTA